MRPCVVCIRYVRNPATLVSGTARLLYPGTHPFLVRIDTPEARHLAARLHEEWLADGDVTAGDTLNSYTSIAMEGIE